MEPCLDKWIGNVTVTERWTCQMQRISTKRAVEMTAVKTLMKTENTVEQRVLFPYTLVRPIY